MSGEILADGNSPMIMTVDQYNERVAYTWKLAVEAEQERITKLLENLAYIDDGGQEMISESKRELIELINGETNE
jgi:hypothetical protein